LPVMQKMLKLEELESTVVNQAEVAELQLDL
jgi:hypothetical protein